MVDSKEENFLARIRSSIAAVEAWDADPSLLAECRLMIPFDSLMPENDQAVNPYFRDDDFLYQGNALFLKRLALFFQKDVMTWVNAPPCEKCGASNDEMAFTESRGPNSEEEREGQANRVEVYCCKVCSETTTFPRYNSVRKLLETRKGRCGEYANLFGLYCRAAGFETRYILDWTDHVWIEVLIADEWIMADSCEGIINKPSMYESGWGKKLNYVVGISVDEVIDLTPKYTRNFHHNDFQERRRQVTSSEAAGERVIAQVNISRQQGLPKPRVEELVRRATRERGALEKLKMLLEWTDDEKHGLGRISGSQEWKVSRQEGGTNSDEEATSSIVRGLIVEQFYPTGPIEIVVFPQSQDGILVSGAQCDVGQGCCISVVVLDDVYLGCVLQCRSFVSWLDVSDFVQSIPSNRIVVLKTTITGEEVSEETKEKLKILGGFRLPSSSDEGVMFVGQIEAHPSWTACSYYTESKGISVKFPIKETSSRSLRIERNVVPRRVLARLPESEMPLQTQLLASDAQKRKAFLLYASKRPLCIGYTTKDGCPIYLLENSSFSFRQSNDWNTFHLLPDALVDEGGNEFDDLTGKPFFDIPVEENFFTSLFGPLLQTRVGASSTTNASVNALRNTRLVGLYFSAHWCPPCRRFTPLLIEVYNHLKELFPMHGFEIVFVSSDRSDQEFHQYYASMPWAAVPYDTNRVLQQQISMRYGIRGIPGLVILDSMSGQIVASVEQSRSEVMQACQRGDEGIEAMFQSWLDRIPDDSKELISMLELSCEQEEEKHTVSNHPYLIRTEPRQYQKPIDPAARVKEIFTKLVADGEEPNAAAAKAIKVVSSQKASSSTFGEGGLISGSFLQVEPDNYADALQKSLARVRENNPYSEDICEMILRTISKFLDNAAREPWNPKFRSMKLSNKIVDRVARVGNTLDLLCRLGMSLEPTSQDFMVTIPLAANMDRIRSDVSKTLTKAG